MGEKKVSKGKLGNRTFRVSEELKETRERKERVRKGRRSAEEMESVPRGRI